MPLFACTQCLCVENTAVSNYWRDTCEDKAPVCSQCDLEIGAWHGRFYRRSAVGMLVDNRGQLWGEGSVSDLPSHTQIMGKILDPSRK